MHGWDTWTPPGGVGLTSNLEWAIYLFLGEKCDLRFEGANCPRSHFTLQTAFVRVVGVSTMRPKEPHHPQTVEGWDPQGSELHPTFHPAALRNPTHGHWTLIRTSSQAEVSSAESAENVIPQLSEHPLVSFSPEDGRQHSSLPPNLRRPTDVHTVLQ